MIRPIAVLLLLLSQIPVTAQPPALFGPASTYWGVGGDPRSIVTGDFNGDGKLDLATANFSGNNVSILLNSGAGTFAAPINSTQIRRPDTSQFPIAPYAIATGDFNGDGRLDVVTANYDYAFQASILLGGGNGWLGPATSLSLINFGTGLGQGFSVAVGDFDQDGERDLAVLVHYAGYTLSLLAVLQGNGDGTFGSPSYYVVGQNYGSSTPHFEYGNAYAVAAADVNGDGKLDLVTANYGGLYTNSVLLGTGTGSFGVPTFIGSTGFATARAVAVGDFNGDGLMDLANSNIGAPNFSVLLGTGAGAFGPVSSFSAEPGSESIAVADFDGDGKLDLAQPNAGGTYPNSNLEVVLGAGAGSFGSPKDFQVGVFPTGVTVGDFNGDGKVDVATADQGGASVSVLLNTTVVVVTNQPPTVTNPGAQTSAEGASVVLAISATDPDGNTLTYSATGLPPGLGINPSTGVITGNLSYTAAGNYNVTVTASDGSLAGSAPFAWTVTNTNQPPTVTNPGAQTSVEGASVVLAISATDPDGNTLTYSATGLPPGLGINPNTGVITGNLSYTAAGNYIVTVTASDGSLTGSATFAWTVTAVSTVGGRVTGGALTFGANGHGGFNVQVDKTGVKGELAFQSGTIRFHAHAMTSLTILPGGKKAWFSGVGTDGKPFTAYVEDNGEPGRNDVFRIWIGGIQCSDGSLRGGNIQIHK